MGSDSVMYEEEGIVDEEVIQQVLEISQSQPAYSQSMGAALYYLIDCLVSEDMMKEQVNYLDCHDQC